MRWPTWSILLVLIFRVHPVISLPSFLPDNFVHWFWQGSVVVGNWLYIDGGEIWARWNASTNASAVWNMQTIAIDLSQDWMTTTVSAAKVSNRTTAMSPMRRPDMYYDPTTNRVYSLGGDPYQVNGAAYNVSQPTQLWSFEPQSDGSVTWALEQGGTTQGFPLTSNIAGGLAATSSTGHYNLGGWIDFMDKQNNTASKALPGMVDFNFANQSWTNQTFNRHYLHGEAQYVPSFGKNGVILFIGGKWPSDASVGDSSSITSLSKILVYDIYSNSFYQQSATNAPVGRFAFCSAGVGMNSTSNSTYEIFIFGGTRGGSGPDSGTASQLATVYVLTLPAFRWIAAPNAAPSWRAVHTCEVIGNRQMISIGGAPDPSNWAATNDTAWNGLRIFDMTNLSWGQTYNASAPAYQPSQQVVDFYAKNYRYPPWDETALQSIFEGNDTSNATAPNKSSNTGAIAGGVVGGVAALAIIAGIAYWFVRRKRGYRQAASASPIEMYDSYYNQRKELPGTDDAQVHEIPGQVHQPYQVHQVHEMPGAGPETHELAADTR